MNRLVLPGASLSPGETRLPAAVSRHARVARVAPGETVEVLNLDGLVGIGSLLSWEGGGCVVAIERVERERGEPPSPLVLALAALHTAAFDWAVEKATELGATAVVPVLTERVQGGRHAARVERWQRIATAAVAQCGRSRAPVVRQPTPLAAFLADVSGVRLLAEAGAAPPPSIGAGAAGITVLVGAEGGFTPAETVAIHAAGFSGLPLGRRTLRAETAAVAALALVQLLAGWLD